MFETFYTTVAGASFTLLGLWWVVLQVRHEEWMRTRAGRTLGYDVTLFFLFPGAMSLLSLVSGDTTIIWQVGFIIASILGGVGALIAIFLLLNDRLIPGKHPILVGTHMATVVIYTLVIVFAWDPNLPSDLGWQVKPLQVEGILLTALLMLALNFAYVMLVGTAHPMPESSPPAPNGAHGHQDGS
jgi:hypothetical protein